MNKIFFNLIVFSTLSVNKYNKNYKKIDDDNDLCHILIILIIFLPFLLVPSPMQLFIFKINAYLFAIQLKCNRVCGCS